MGNNSWTQIEEHTFDFIILLIQDILEPYVGKLTRTVLKREEGSNPLDLSDYVSENKKRWLTINFI